MQYTRRKRCGEDFEKLCQVFWPGTDVREALPLEISNTQNSASVHRVLSTETIKKDIAGHIPIVYFDSWSHARSRMRFSCSCCTRCPLFTPRMTHNGFPEKLAVGHVAWVCHLPLSWVTLTLTLLTWRIWWVPNTVMPRLKKIILSGITFVSRNVIFRRFL